MAEAHAEGEFHVGVWLGIGPDGRGRVRVEGEKRLEAPLPTSRERLRRVLLSAIQAPRHVPASAEGAPAEEEPASPSEPAPPPAEPRPGDAEDVPPPEEQVIPLGPSSEDEPPQP